MNRVRLQVKGFSRGAEVGRKIEERNLQAIADLALDFEIPALVGGTQLVQRGQVEQDRLNVVALGQAAQSFHRLAEQRIGIFMLLLLEQRVLGGVNGNEFRPVTGVKLAQFDFHKVMVNGKAPEKVLQADARQKFTDKFRTVLVAELGPVVRAFQDNEVGMVKNADFPEIGLHLRIRPGVHTRVDDLDFSSTARAILQQALQNAAIGLRFAQSPAEGSGISEAKDAESVRWFGGLEFQAACTERIDVNRFTVHFRVAILVRFELPIENRIWFVNLHVAIAAKAQHNLQHRETEH